MRPITLLSLFLWAGLAGAKGGPDTATRAALARPFFSKAEVVARDVCPPRFDLRLTAPMPTPGWKVAVDEVTKPDAEGRVRVRLTGKRPKGLMPQVITPTPFEVPLGGFRKGVYLIDVFYRPASDGTYRRVHAFVLDAQ